MTKEKYRITGMTCSACVAAVEKAALKLPGVKSASVSLMSESLTIEYDGAMTEKDDIIRAVKAKGYGCDVYKKKTDSTEESGKMKLRLIVSVCFLVPLMYLAMAGMLSLPLPAFLSENAVLSGAIQFILCLPVVAVNYKFFTVGIKRLLKLEPNMDSLIMLGSGAALIYSAYSYACIIANHSGMHHLYIDSAAMILTLVTLGKYFEARGRNKTAKALHGIEKLSPDYSTVIEDGEKKYKKTEELKLGDIVFMKPGENLPADGIIVDGSPSIDCSAINGESLPLELSIGDGVNAGTTNLNRAFSFEVTKCGSDTTLGKMITLIEDAAASKAPIARLADKVAGVFVPIVMLIALLCGVFWFFKSQNIETALVRMISVLVIACPCSLGLATPVAIMAGTGRAAEKSVLFSSATALETLSKADTVVLDKTGTLTKGQLRVNDIIALSDTPRNELLSIAAALENGSEHPIAKAVCLYAEENKTEAKAADGFEALAGSGISAVIDGKRYFAGNRSLFSGVAESDIPQETKALLSSLESTGSTLFFIGDEAKLLGIVSLSDTVKDDSRDAVAYCLKNGINVIMITGDNPGSAAAVAAKCGIRDYIAGAKPDEKESKIRELKSQGHTTVMIGDGVNDAPALKSADIGVAIGSGTDIAIENSDVVLIHGTLGDFVSAVTISKKTMRVIKQNLFWAFFYNCAAITLAVVGIATPMIASAAMSLSSLCVVTNALRLRFIKTADKDEKEISSKCSCEKEVNNKTSVCSLEKCANPQNDIKNNIERGNKTMKKTIIIDGMMCSHCTGRVEKALNSIPGVCATVELDKKAAFVTADESITNETLTKAVTDEGYTVVEIKNQ